MTPLITLSIAFVAFNAGLAFGFMILAIVRNHYEDEDSGAPEGDQTTRFRQSPRSPSAH